MTKKATQTTTTVDETVVAPVAEVTVVATPAVPKAPSKKSQADVIFAAKLVEREQGLFGSNKEFRASVLHAFMDTLTVSVASAATMYNSCKKEAEEAGTTNTLGRDPKKAKPEATGQRGRPKGSKNAEKVVPATDAVDASPALVITIATPAVEATEEAVAA